MCTNKDNNLCCCIFNIIASLLVAAGVAAIFFAGLITSITFLLYITLILGILGIVTFLGLVLCSKKNRCECIENSCLVASSVGAIITSIFALAATGLATLSVAAAILIGSVTFFLIYTLISLINMLICKICKKEY